MNEQLSPWMAVPRMDAVPTGDLDGLRKAFAGSGPVPLLQRFPGGNADAKPTGTVRAGWSGTSIHLLAELEDDYIFTRATQFNEPVFQLGDCFEIFLQPPGETPYLEFHVAPNNVVFQLLYPPDFAKYRGRISREEFLDRFTVKEPAFVSQVWPEPEENRWTVFASIDLRLLVPALATPATEEWRFHFSRYDYLRGESQPVLSCTSVLRRLDFHAREDWGTLRFEP